MIWLRIWVSRTTRPAPITDGLRSTGGTEPIPSFSASSASQASTTPSPGIFRRRIGSSVAHRYGSRKRSRGGSLAGPVGVQAVGVGRRPCVWRWRSRSRRLLPASERRHEVLALTLRQPWASAIVELGKDVENRTWTTPYRGELAIHAGKSVDNNAKEVAAGLAVRERLPSGCVVALVTLTDIVRDSGSEWARLGNYHWLITDVRPLVVPVPCIGRQSLFKLPLDVEQAVLDALVLPAGGV